MLQDYRHPIVQLHALLALEKFSLTSAWLGPASVRHVQPDTHTDVGPPRTHTQPRTRTASLPRPTLSRPCERSRRPRTGATRSAINSASPHAGASTTCVRLSHWRTRAPARLRFPLPSALGFLLLTGFVAAYGFRTVPSPVRCLDTGAPCRRQKGILTVVSCWRPGSRGTTEPRLWPGPAPHDGHQRHAQQGRSNRLSEAVSARPGGPSIGVGAAWPGMNVR